MLTLLEGYRGSIEVNDIAYSDLNAAVQAFKGSGEQLTIVLNRGAKIKDNQAQEIQELEGSPIYKIKVRQHMTKPASSEFDFQDKWNSGIPMPMRIMVGRKLKETRGMVQMELWGEIIDEISTHCMKCGRTLTNTVSKYFGIGPECGSHGYNNPFETDEELETAIEEVQKQLKEIKWTGWIIKSSIEEETYLENRRLD